ncbi:MAG TPA: hypothetical protein VK488_06770 [Gaiellaceae bacterium]|nr:hypothetical protein [Gaiellaceae bacterium]
MEVDLVRDQAGIRLVEHAVIETPKRARGCANFVLSLRLPASKGDVMTDRHDRSAALTGITAVALWVIGFVVLKQIADQPATDATPALALAYFKGERNAILAGTFFFMLGTVFFLFFLGALRARLFLAEGGARRVTGTGFAGGVVAGAALLFWGSTQAAGTLNRDNLSPEAAQVYRGLAEAFMYATEPAAGILVLTTGLVIVRTRALPVWLGRISVVVGLWLLIPPIGWAALISAFPLWVIVVSLVLYREGGAAGPTAT